jgi:hypothetical protein
MTARTPGVARGVGSGRTMPASRSERPRWYTTVGGSASARNSEIARMTVLCTGLRARPCPTDASVALCDYPVGGQFHLKLIDTRTGRTLKEITLGRVGLPQYSCGNGCWNPAGTHIIFQVQAGVNAIYTAGRDPGFGTGCNFYDYTVATDTVTALTADTFPTEVETQWARFQPLLYSATGLLYTERYLDQPGTEGSGRWRLRAATYTAATPELTNDTLYLNPITLEWGYYIVPMGLFPASHPYFANMVLVAGTLDSFEQLPRQMKLYAVSTPSTKVKFGAVVHADAWNEGCLIAPDGRIWMASNGNGILHGSSDLENEVTTREYQVIATDGATYTEVSGFNRAGASEAVGAGYGIANFQHGGAAPDGSFLLAGLVKKNALGVLTHYRVIRLDLGA